METISWSIELRTVLAQMDLEPSEEELQDMIREVDADQSGTVSFVEFVGRWKKQKISIDCAWKDLSSLDMVKKAVDTNKSSREELFRAFQLFGMKKKIRRGNKYWPRIIIRTDLDQNGFITMEELRTG